MSVRAMEWALKVPGKPSSAAMTLMGLAWHADEKGRAAFPSLAKLAEYANKSERSIRSDLRALEAAGLIRRGDQRRAARLPSGQRPTVYDLAVPRAEAGFPPGRKLSVVRPEAGFRQDRKQASAERSLKGPERERAPMSRLEWLRSQYPEVDPNDSSTWLGLEVSE